MTLKSQVRFGKITTVAGIVIIVGLLYYVISRKDAIINRAYGALDSRLSGGDAGGGEAPPPEAGAVPTAPLTVIGTGPYRGGAAKKQPTGALTRVIQHIRTQPAAPTPAQPAAPTPAARQAAAAEGFQNAFSNLLARPSRTNPRQLIVTDRNQVQYATSSTPNARENFYNSIRNQRPTGTFGGPAQRAAAPANARRVLKRAAPSAIANFRNALAAANARRAARG